VTAAVVGATDVTAAVVVPAPHAARMPVISRAVVALRTPVTSRARRAGWGWEQVMEMMTGPDRPTMLLRATELARRLDAVAAR
jgi:hypothetical protein